MENRCFIIMPPGEPAGYPQGHFNRVYEYVIVPACRTAGYWPVRSDSAIVDNPMDVAKSIIDSEIVLCDLSANNSNAFYGLAIRHSLDLPVVLMKDLKTFVRFDMKDFALVEFDESLRIDTVQKAIENLSEALKNAIQTKKERHSLLQRLSIGLTEQPTQSDSASSFEHVVHEEEVKVKEIHLPKISPLPDYVGDPLNELDIEKLKAGNFIFHLNHGKGKLNFVKNNGKDKLASIQFDSGTKLLVLAESDFFRKIIE